MSTSIICLNPECRKVHSNLENFCSVCGNRLKLRRRYQAIEFLGQGGFGKTFKAHDSDRLNKLCVIKQLLPYYQGSEAFEQALKLFKKEAEQLEELGIHSQIPSLFAFFDENRHFYLIQQFIEGQNLLAKFLKDGKFSEAEIKELLKQILTILDYIHQRHVIHRDIKPENIIYQPNGNFVLIDFGISKNVNATVASEVIGGTRGYAPPEQMLNGNVNPSSDIYSLGVTCIRLLTGCLPSNTEDKLFDSSPTKNNWQNLCQVSNGLAKILNKMIKDDCQKRYQSAQEVQKDLALLSRKTSLPFSTIPIILLTCIIFMLVGSIFWFKNKPSPSFTSSTSNEVHGIITDYNNLGDKIKIFVRTSEQKDYQVIFERSLLNQIPNAPLPLGLKGKKITIKDIDPSVTNTVLDRHIQIEFD